MKKTAMTLTAAILLTALSGMTVSAHSAESAVPETGRAIASAYRYELEDIADDIENEVHADISSTLVHMKKQRIEIVNAADGSAVYSTDSPASIEKISAALDPDSWILLSEIPSSANATYQYVLYEEGKKGLASLFNKDIAVRFTVYDQSCIHMEVLTVNGQGALARSSSMQMSFSIPDNTAATLGDVGQFAAK